MFVRWKKLLFTLLHLRYHRAIVDRNIEWLFKLKLFVFRLISSILQVFVRLMKQTLRLNLKGVLVYTQKYMPATCQLTYEYDYLIMYLRVSIFVPTLHKEIPLSF